jgi:hypothetical protein
VVYGSYHLSEAMQILLFTAWGFSAHQEARGANHQHRLGLVLSLRGQLSVDG